MASSEHLPVDSRVPSIMAGLTQFSPAWIAIDTGSRKAFACKQQHSSSAKALSTKHVSKIHQLPLRIQDAKLCVHLLLVFGISEPTRSPLVLSQSASVCLFVCLSVCLSVSVSVSVSVSLSLSLSLSLSFSFSTTSSSGSSLVSSYVVSHPEE